MIALVDGLDYCSATEHSNSLTALPLSRKTGFFMPDELCRESVNTKPFWEINWRSVRRLKLPAPFKVSISIQKLTGDIMSKYLDAQDNLNRLIAQSKAVLSTLTVDDAHTKVNEKILSDTLWLLSDRINDIDIAFVDLLEAVQEGEI